MPIVHGVVWAETSTGVMINIVSYDLLTNVIVGGNKRVCPIDSAAHNNTPPITAPFASNVIVCTFIALSPVRLELQHIKAKSCTGDARVNTAQ